MKLDLEHVPIKGESDIEARAWRIVRAAYAEREPSSPRPHRGRLLVAAAAAAVTATLVAVAVSPAGSSLLHSIRREIGLTHAASALTRLPSAGTLLVTSKSGPWIVQPDGSKRLLGRYAEASWSPHGLYVAATRRHELFAVDPRGTVRWSLARRGAVRLPRWAPDGYRIAYLEGSSLRIVAGDGTGDHLFAAAAARVPVAWRPNPNHEHVLAYVSAAQDLVLADADTGHVQARRRLAVMPTQLVWSDDSRRLAVISGHKIAVFAGDGEPVTSIGLKPELGPAAFMPGSHRLTVVLTGARSAAVLFDLDRPLGRPDELFTGSGRFSGLAWAPDGRWLLIAWPTANQWLFVAPRGRVAAVAGIATQFSSGATRATAPALDGWCCAPEPG